MIVGLVSAKGAPGVTTAALALTAASGDGLLVELDPSGGSLECWLGGTGEPGLIRVASGLRRAADPEALAALAVMAPPGVWSVTAPTAGGLAESTIAATGERLVDGLRRRDRIVVVDGGRWSRSQPTAGRLTGCDVVAVVCSPSLEGVEAARWLIDPLAAVTGVPVAAVLNCDKPYSSTEVQAALGVPVVGVLPWDRRAVNVLVTTGTSRGWARSGLARAARSTLDVLRELTAEGVGSVA